MKKLSHFTKFRFALTAVLLTAFLNISGNAQFNVLSTETLAKGEKYVELGSLFKPNNNAENRRFSTFLPRFAYGVTRNFEVGVTMLGNVQPGEDDTTLSPMFKYRVYHNEKHAVTLTVGDNVFIPLKKSRAYNLGNQLFVQVTKTFTETGTSVTTGSYWFTKNVVAENANRAGGLFGVEQPINKRFGVSADWITGKHDSGYATVGFYFHPTKRSVSYIGYSMGNSGLKEGNHYVFANIGYSLP